MNVSVARHKKPRRFSSERILPALSIFVLLGAAGCTHMPADGLTHPAAQSKIVLIPNAVDFSSVAVGQKNSQTLKITNDDITTRQINSVHIAGAGLTISGLKLPFTLNPQGSQIFNIEFAPAASGPVNGALTVECNHASIQTISVTGTGVKGAAKLQTNPASVNFGNMTVKRTAAQKITLSNTGNARVTVSQLLLSGPGFGVSELPAHFELEPQQETSFLISFLPLVIGQAKGSLTLVSKDLSASLTIPLTGAGVEGGPAPMNSSHTVTLGWMASASNVRGYNVYRGLEASGGNFTKLTASPISSVDYRDSDVSSGSEYFYFVTSVSHDGQESSHSQEVSATIPKS
jgi:hypothetical protein